MPRPKGKPKTGGRKVGTPNKTPPEIRALAQSHGPMIINRLVKIMENSSDTQAGLAAAKIIVERGCGKVRNYDNEPSVRSRPAIPDSRTTLKELFEKLGIHDEPTDPSKPSTVN